MLLRNMLKELLQNKTFRKIVDKAISKNYVLDIVIFGSVVRGKDTPNDIDILVIFSNKVETDFLYDFRKEFEDKKLNVHIIGKTYKHLFESSFLARESILTEGYSLKENDFLSRLYGFSTLTLFRYSLKGASNSERMGFYYSLYGRGNEGGVLDKLGAHKFSDGVIACPIERKEDIVEFFMKKKIKFEEFPILLPSRLMSKKFLELK